MVNENHPPTLATIKVQRAKTPPETLTIEQVHALVDATRSPRLKLFFWTTYSMGLRLEEARNLQAVLKCLAPYVYRVAISDHRLVSFDENEVTYKIKPSGENRYRERTIDACRFVGNFLQHVLPGGFQKIRYYGWTSPHHRISLEEVLWLLMILCGLTFVLQSSHNDQAERSKPSCRYESCGGEMQVLLVTDWQRRVVYKRGPPDLSGTPLAPTPHPRKELA
ncbi:MAG: transposase [Planctomycetota bacterium]